MALFYLYVPQLQQTLGTAQLPLEHWLLPLAFGLGLLLLDQGRKAAVRRWKGRCAGEDCVVSKVPKVYHCLGTFATYLGARWVSDRSKVWELEWRMIGSTIAGARVLERAGLNALDSAA
jgi:hypothetical protein